MTILAHTQNVLESCKEDSFAGYDPFDGLNSKLFDLFPSLKNSLVGLAWLQFHKRLPINTRSVLGVSKKRNPKGVGLFILGLIEDYKRTGDQSFIDEAIKLADWVIAQRCDEKVWGNSCWGYHFDWKARAFYVPTGKPNVITTIYVSKALLALGETVSNEDYINVAYDSAAFIINHLFIDDLQPFISYIPGENTFVHNASLWGAAWLATVGVRTNNSTYKEVAYKVAMRSVNEQRHDGSWTYGSRSHHQFIDGFHTGYNLEALHEIKHALNTFDFDVAIKQGLNYYKNELIEEDGTAKYYNNNKYPLDMHSVAQAVITLLKVCPTEQSLELAHKIIIRSIELMYNSNKNRFAYQRNKYFTNNVNYIRWTQAWVYYSFSYFNSFNLEKSNATD